MKIMEFAMVERPRISRKIRNMKQEHKLNRTDNRPIAFLGEQIINETSKSHDSTRWFRIQVFTTDDPPYYVGIARITCWPKERDQYWAEPARSKKQVSEVLWNHAPPSVPPSGETWTPEQTKQQQELRVEYQELLFKVVGLLQGAGDRPADWAPSRR